MYLFSLNSFNILPFIYFISLTFGLLIVIFKRKQKNIFHYIYFTMSFLENINKKEHETYFIFL
jgi:hypothetical protein